MFLKHGGYSSAVEHWIVVPVVAGSNPVIHPFTIYAPVAQLDRASDFESAGLGSNPTGRKKSF